MPFEWPAPGRPIGCPRVGHPPGAFGFFSYYQLITSFSTIVRLKMDFTFDADVALFPPRVRTDVAAAAAAVAFHEGLEGIRR
jgi:hypothetical protein